MLLFELNYPLLNDHCGKITKCLDTSDSTEEI